MYCWFSHTGDHEKWKVADSSQRARILSELAPQFITVLDASGSPQKDWTREEYLKMSYSGPMYFDWDADEDVEDAIRGAIAFVIRLRDEYDVPPEQLRIYATGGRGIHIEIPIGVWSNKPPLKGWPMLPMVFREIALKLATERLDTTVYSVKKGRMWRVPNVQRSNGRYKVPITYEELSVMDCAGYAEITSSERSIGVYPAEVVAIGLQALFNEMSASVASKLVQARKAVDERDKLVQFRGEYPTSVQLLLMGEYVKEEASWNDIAMQVAILSQALGKSENDMVEAARGLIEKHRGTRYIGPRQREEALRERYRTVQDNPCYLFTLGGLKSIAMPDWEPEDVVAKVAVPQTAPVTVRRKPPATPVVVADADPEGEDIEDAPETELPEGQELAEGEELPAGEVFDDLEVTDDGISEETQLQIRLSASNANAGMFFARQGLFSPASGKGGGLDMLSNVCMANPTTLMSVTLPRRKLGVEVDLLVGIPDSKTLRHRRVRVPATATVSRQSLNNFLDGYCGWFRGTDIQATVVAAIIDATAQKGERVIYSVTQEGVSVITDPDSPDDDPRQIVVWADKDCCLEQVVRRGRGGKVTVSVIKSERFRFVPNIATSATFKPDVQTAPAFDASAIRKAADKEHIHEFLEKALRFNRSDYTVAAALGWFVATFYRSLYHSASGQFPLLVLYGGAGAGKTSTSTTLSRMFWGRRDPPVYSANRSSMTPFRKKTALSSSCSPPLLLDEFKLQSIGERSYHEWLGDFRTMYTGGVIGTGGVGDGSAVSSYRDIVEAHLFTPVVIHSETMIDETAMQERSVMVPMSQEQKDQHIWAFLTHPDQRFFWTRLGATVLSQVMHTDIGGFVDDWHATHSKNISTYAGQLKDRPMVNMSVILTALDKLADSLEPVYPVGRQRIEELKQAYIHEVTESVMHSAPRSEAVKWLTELMAMADRSNDATPDNARILFNRELTVVYKGNGNTEDDRKNLWVEIDLRRAFAKYLEQARSTPQIQYYATFDACWTGLVQAGLGEDRICIGSSLKSDRTARIIGFRADVFDKNGIRVPSHRDGYRSSTDAA